MENLTLSTKECLLAAAKAGARQFFGLTNPFFGMEREAVQQEIGALQLSLEKRGYAEVGFDDVFTLKPEVAELIGLCTDCDSYLLAQLAPTGARKRQLLIYAGEKGTALARVQDDEVALSRLAEERVLQTLLEELHPTAAGSAEPCTARIRQGDLAEVRELAVDDPAAAVTRLTEQGCPQPVADLLVRGLRKETARYIFFRTDLRRRTLTQMMALQSEDGAVCMTLEDMEEDLWNAAYLPGGISEEELKDLCPVKGGAHEVL